MAHDLYENPLNTRYASAEMSRLFSDQRKFSTWRRLWVILAEAEHEMGLPVSREQIEEMKAQVDNIDFQVAAAYEKKLRHDVMAHVHTFGDLCPGAMPIIHLGATSCYVTDNTDLILMREALELIARRLAVVIDALGKFATTHRELPCLGFTHLQPAQPTTVGKRATLWIYDLALDLAEIEHRIESLRARSVKGTTGTQASFLALFHGDHAKVRQLEAMVAERMGFSGSYAVTGQTYTRKVDAQIVDTLSGVAQSAHKLASDLRLLASRKEMEEPFEANQIGSSAMAYKRNPMRSERVCALARFVMSLQSSPAATLATQWMERTLDDSANRRLVIPQAFLGIDAVLLLLTNISSGLVVYPKTIAANLNAELPFMASENLMMAAVERGGDRQELHEVIRAHSQAAALDVKQEGKPNTLLERLRGEPAFAGVDLAAAMNPRDFVGRAPEQVDEFVADIIEPIRARYRSALGQETEGLKV
ncbi:adenylosuccinate lyase [Pirellula staleyi DSM 6068]|uniref:Adenylosuccinate lyase n=1 Tax=Pirellula staleyi (strain ATCC 27377 / DSM 6068 / ICPB 4128) TaxID=530564 RepID=D2R2V1_PIRSD|nr:adenylosuccinate lyase [Pirellula staleyi]ADB18684.1 adenylosuccinate lyase [Pirellula staleyi DSM 6068]